MKTNFTFEQLGWNNHFSQYFTPLQAQGFEAGRIAIENRNNYVVLSTYGELKGEISGKLQYTAQSEAEFPKVGDWVVMQVFDQQAIIHEVLPRQTKFTRRAAGKANEEQVVATNIDALLIVQSVDQNYSLRRLERYLVMAYEGNIEPVIVLSKVDLADDLPQKLQEVSTVAPEVPLLTVSNQTTDGYKALENWLPPQKTIAVVGSSGVGKSTIINHLLGESKQETQAIRSKDAKGRHTTTRREMHITSTGNILIDTPGMRELQLWENQDGLSQTFADIEALAEQCHFKDCKHITEIKCAVLKAIEEGTLTEARYQSYLKLQRETAYLEASTDFIREKNERFKRIQKAYRQQMKHHKK
ncbi:ribosome small subunit-dependent GTPase A [marine bacterium AO1-C]|nr:ribosome small subunit-dependent GTPase A [marine bacterium AO1-C]